MTKVNACNLTLAYIASVFVGFCAVFVRNCDESARNPTETFGTQANLTRRVTVSRGFMHSMMLTQE